MIQGYPGRPSIYPGPNTLTLHVSTTAPEFRVDFYRQGQTLIYQTSSGWIKGQNVASGVFSQDWRWPEYTFSIPEEWISGAYIAIFVEGDGKGNKINSPDASTADGRDAKAFFVVKSPDTGTSVSILYKVSLATFQAYNYTGGGSLYTSHTTSSLLRPGGATGGETSFTGIAPLLPGDEDFYDHGSPRQTFAHWDPSFIGWLEKNGYRVDYCTDLDLDEDQTLLASYGLLLSVGHDEYWTDRMRTNVETFIAGGGNVAFFSGNTCWGLIEFVDNGTTLTRKAEYNLWYQQAGDRPENTLTGVSYRNAGGWWVGKRVPALGYTVQHADHWVYHGTGLANGSIFGDGDDECLIGYECDGAAIDKQRDIQGLMVPSHEDGTPTNFVILGVAVLGAGWNIFNDEDTDRKTFRNSEPYHAATMGMYTRNGTVFTAATTDWSRVLASGNPHVERITQNVLNALSDRRPYPQIYIRLESSDSMCVKDVVVVAQEATLSVDVSQLFDRGDLTFLWNVSHLVGVGGLLLPPKGSGALSVIGPSDAPTLTVSGVAQGSVEVVVTVRDVFQEKYVATYILHVYTEDVFESTEAFCKWWHSLTPYLTLPVPRPNPERPVPYIPTEKLQEIMNATQRLIDVNAKFAQREGII